jgi:beta-glucosidase/6-phospho-beta-glucosidase/beta-galactosidase
MRRLTFPAGFLWGTSTSAHQVEGGNENNDWWDWEHRPGAINGGTRSGAACGWWAGRRGGWTSWDTVESFARYAQECARRLAQRVPLWVTINEPAACAAAGYALTYLGARPRGRVGPGLGVPRRYAALARYRRAAATDRRVAVRAFPACKAPSTSSA